LEIWRQVCGGLYFTTSVRENNFTRKEIYDRTNFVPAPKQAGVDKKDPDTARRNTNKVDFVLERPVSFLRV
jgi:hypothetical protein